MLYDEQYTLYSENWPEPGSSVKVDPEFLQIKRPYGKNYMHCSKTSFWII